MPHVITVHGGDVFALPGKLMARFKRFALRHADAVTVKRSVTASAVRALDAGGTPVQRIPMGVSVTSLRRDAEQVAQICARYRAGNGPLILFVGRMVEEKGVRDLIDAVGLLGATLPDARALLVGEGQDRAELEAHAVAAGLAPQVHFTGWVQPAEIPKYMAAADVFVAPSRRAPNGWVEAQGLTCLEAMIARVRTGLRGG